MTECERIIEQGILPESFFKEEERCGFIVTEKRKKIWAVEMDLYLEFARVCEKYGLKYYAMYGSILGAVRHKGFIPWDDDFDVCMFRDDYEKLCKIYAKEFVNPYFLQVAETDPGYYVSFAKLRNSNTTSVSMPFKNSMINQGIAIDIFPLDYSIPSECEEISSQINESILKCSSYMKKGSEEYLNERQLANYKKYQTQDPYGEYLKIQKLASRISHSDYVSNAILTVYHWKKHTFPLRCFDDSVKKDFENIQIRIPSGWKDILENCYGDYMQFPPIEQRGGWHSNVLWNPDIPYEKYKIKGDVMEDTII